MPETRLILKLLWTALTSRSTAQFYDRVSPFYEAIFQDHRIHIQTIARELERYPGGARILDLACGTGMLSRALALKGFAVIGLDVSVLSLQALHHNDPSILLLQADASALPFQAGSFDAVVCLGAWRHFEDIETVISKIIRVLRNDGIFLVGYFPPKLGGLFAVPDNRLGKVLCGIYDGAVRFLGYRDQVSNRLEHRTLALMEKRFCKVDAIPSGQGFRLLSGQRTK